MNILVTGGLGFVGSHLVEVLLQNFPADDIIVLDNYQHNCVDSTIFDGKVTCINQSIYDFFSTDFGNMHFDSIFHCASVVGILGVLKYAGIIGPTTLRDISILIDYCIKHDSKLIYISSSEVYGRSGILCEEDSSIIYGSTPRIEYGVSKLLSEICVRNSNELIYHIIRPFNIIGTRQKSDVGFVVARFVDAIINRKPLEIFYTGQQVRAFTDVDDVCNGIIEIYKSDFSNEIWNIGNPENIMTINKLANLLCELTNYDKNNIIHINPIEVYGKNFSEVTSKIPCICKITEFTNWIPKVSVEATLKKVIEYENIVTI